jgi:hypothetical protein
VVAEGEEDKKGALSGQNGESWFKILVVEIVDEVDHC